MTFIVVLVSLPALFLLANGASLSLVTDGEVANEAEIPYLDDMRFARPTLNNNGQKSRNGLLSRSARWPGGVVVYQLDARFTSEERNEIQRGINDIISKTCITFKLRTNEVSYVSVKRGDPGSGCWSYVGRTGGAQILNLQAPTSTNRATCIVSYVVSHEFIHAIGYFHEQSRPDRDDFISIKWENVQPEFKSAFDKYGTNYVSTFRVPYDYHSIMQYRANSFAINQRLPTMVAKQPNVVLGGNKVTPLDVQKLNNMYAGICPTTPNGK